MAAIKLSPQHVHYEGVAKAIHYLVENRIEQPSLEELAEYMNMSKYHMQRLFTKWVGISPKLFLQYLTKEYAKQQLQNSSVLSASLASGLSGSSRLHDLLITHESITPGEFKRNGAGMTISYGFHSSPFGYCLIATTSRGLCKFAFFDNEDERDRLLKELYNDWILATIVHDESITHSTFTKIFQADLPEPRNINLILKATPFRLMVWEALLRIEQGTLVSYQQIAQAINKPNAVRAVASAVASNQIGYLIPCHRVILSSGALGRYRWGSVRKTAIIMSETRQIG